MQNTGRVQFCLHLYINTECWKYFTGKHLMLSYHLKEDLHVYTNICDKLHDILLMCCFQDIFSSMNTPKNFVIYSLLTLIFSIRRLRKVCWCNWLFKRGWNNNHLILSTFRDNFFDLIHVERSFTFMLAKRVSMLFWYTEIIAYHQQT